MVDRTTIKFNQGCIIALLVLAFLFEWPWLVLLVMLVMAVGTIWPQAGLFKLTYERLVRPRGWLRARVEPDNPDAHLFAQGVGALFLAAGSLFLWLGNPLLGWVLVWVVIALAAINVIFNFCLGCFVHHQLARRGVIVSLPSWRRAGTEGRRT